MKKNSTLMQEEKDDRTYMLYNRGNKLSSYSSGSSNSSSTKSAFDVPLNTGFHSNAYGTRGNLQLPLYYPNSWYFSNYSSNVQWVNSPEQYATAVQPQPRRRNKSPVLLDDIKSAALALTSLSLSPVAPHSADGLRLRKDWSPNDCFIFPPTNTPPTNTPTEDNDQSNSNEKNDNVSAKRGESVRDNKQSVIKANFLDKGSKQQYNIKQRTVLEPTDCGLHPSTAKKHKDSAVEKENVIKIKPRSFSHRDYAHDLTRPLPIRSKPRSNSFDAVGRASKYIASLDPYQQYDDRSFIGHHSVPSPRSRMICGRLGSLDDGLGSSSGSADSVEHIPVKRKHSHRTVFRCMWRGCDKELTTLSGIILHVRHTHIGLSNAGEEEFYFDDVNIDSTTTSGISSSEESLADACSKRKYRKSFTEDNIRATDLGHINSFSERDRTPAPVVSEVIRHTDKKRRDIKDVGSIKQALPSPSNNELKYPSTLNAKDTPLVRSSEKEGNLAIEKNTARHLDSPSFNINFSDAQIWTRVFSPTADTTAKRRPKGRKKCRKVYGMSNKNLWCTQCRWKKACARFT